MKIIIKNLGKVDDDFERLKNRIPSCKKGTIKMSKNKRIIKQSSQKNHLKLLGKKSRISQPNNSSNVKEVQNDIK